MPEAKLVCPGAGRWVRVAATSDLPDLQGVPGSRVTPQLTTEYRLGQVSRDQIQSWGFSKSIQRNFEIMDAVLFSRWKMASAHIDLHSW